MCINKMVRFKRDFVTINVDRQFFDEKFEPSRKRIQSKLGLDRLTQKDFTKMMGKSDFKFDFDLLNNNIGGLNATTKRGKRKKR